MKLHVVLAALVALLLTPALRAEDYEARTFKSSGTSPITVPYRLLKPKTVEEGKAYPLVLFLSGKGECGNDNISQLKNGARIFDEAGNREKFPCFEIVPQTANGHESSRHGTGEASADTVAILELVAAMQKEFPIDARRLYITGLSMGGWATWDILYRKPEMFAAAVPVTGGANAATAPDIAKGKTAIWCFHGGADTNNPTISSQQMMAALKKAGADPKYTEYPGVGHNSWDKAYAEPELVPWMFAQKRN